MLEFSGPDTQLWYAADSEVGDMTIASSEHFENETHSEDVQGSTARLTGLPFRDLGVGHEASMAAMALGSKTLVIGEQRHWWASEEDIVLVAISVIFVALFAIIAVAAAAVLTMG
jgi:hypothetical protein